MAVDTETKRRSVAGMLIAALAIAPVPDGTVAAVDREHIIGIYAGIAPSSPSVDTDNIHIYSTSKVEPVHVGDSGDNILVAGDIEVQGKAYLGQLEVTGGLDIDINGSDLIGVGTITSGDITIFDTTPILVFQDSDSLGAASVGFIEWRDSGGGRAGFFGNSSSGNDDLLWKNEQGGNIGIQTTGAGEFQIIADTAITGTLTATGDIMPVGSAFLVFEKASGNGIKVDQTTPTFGFADLLGDQFSKNTGGTKPTLTAYNGAVDAWQFSNGDEAFLSYHIPHDYVLGTDIHLHIHWSQNAAGATGGTVDFKYFAIYSKGHNQTSGSAFTATPITATFSSIDINDGAGGLNRYQQHFTEVTISGASATVALFDRDDFEPDGVIELTLEMDATNLTGTPSDPFIHFADIHYQTTGVIGTKSRTPDFYA